MAEKSTVFNITLEVEDGTGKENANSYISLAYADSYAVNRNYSDWISQSDYVKKSAIIKAMDYVDNIFNWRGRKMTKQQSLNFPRVDIIDDDGFNLSGDIPEKLKKAICEAAFYVYKQYSLFAKKDANGAVKKDRKKADVAEIEKEYFSNSEVKIDYTSTYESLDNLLSGLFIQKGTGSIVRRVIWED